MSIPTSASATLRAPVRRGNYRRTSDLDFCILNVLRPWIENTLIEQLNAPASQHKLVLDVGCGNQPFRQLIESYGGDYHSLDVTQNVMGSVDCIGAIDDPFLHHIVSQRTFDVILCTEVLEHVFDWTAAFRNLSLLTSPGGVVILTCPFFWPLHEEPHDYWRATPHALRRIAAEMGFAIEVECAAGDLWDVFGTALGNARFTVPMLGKCGTIVSTLAWAIRKIALLVLRTGWLQKFIRVDSLQGAFYLSNLYVLRRTP